MASRNIKDIAEEIVRERISRPDIPFVFDRKTLTEFQMDAEKGAEPLVKTWPEEDILDTADAVAEIYGVETEGFEESLEFVISEVKVRIDIFLEVWWDETASAAAEKARERKEGYTRYFRVYFKEGGLEYPVYLGTNMDKATEAAFLADRTTEAKGSGTAFFEYRDLPEKDTLGKDKDEVKNVWDKTFGGARIPRAVWDYLW